MKLKYCFTLTVILIVLFSFTAVVANENITDDLAIDVNDSSVSVYNDLKDCESQDILNETLSSSDERADLSTRISVENTYYNDRFNRAGYEVPWTVTAKVNGGIAHDVKVYVNFSDNMELVSHEDSLGAFNPTTGIWNIGDLSSFDNASLLIIVKLKTDGRFYMTVNATTTSTDVNLSNNEAILKIKSGQGKKPSNTTKTSDGGLQDDDMYFDEYHPFIVEEPLEKDPDKPKNEDPQPKGDPTQSEKTSPQSGGNSGSGQSGGNSGQSEGGSGQSGSSSTSNVNEPSGDSSGGFVKSLSNTVLGNLESLISIFDSNSNENDSNSESNLSPGVVKAINAQDYTRFPILIFVSFLIILMAFVGYDKIKS